MTEIIKGNEKKGGDDFGKQWEGIEQDVAFQNTEQQRRTALKEIFEQKTANSGLNSKDFSELIQGVFDEEVSPDIIKHKSFDKIIGSLCGELISEEGWNRTTTKVDEAGVTLHLGGTAASCSIAFQKTQEHALSVEIDYFKRGKRPSGSFFERKEYTNGAILVGKEYQHDSEEGKEIFLTAKKKRIVNGEREAFDEQIVWRGEKETRHILKKGQETFITTIEPDGSMALEYEQEPILNPHLSPRDKRRKHIHEELHDLAPQYDKSGNLKIIEPIMWKQATPFSSKEDKDEGVKADYKTNTQDHVDIDDLSEEDLRSLYISRPPSTQDPEKRFSTNKDGGATSEVSDQDRAMIREAIRKVASGEIDLIGMHQQIAEQNQKEFREYTSSLSDYEKNLNAEIKEFDKRLGMPNVGDVPQSDKKENVGNKIKSFFKKQK